jgi:hypothetical protein
MPETYRRHDIPDQTWALLEPHLPGRRGTWGGQARDNRQFYLPCSGYCARVPRGRICRLPMGTGRIPTDAFVGGETLGSGSGFWNNR